MATTKRESNLGKEKRGASPSNPSSTGHGARRSNNSNQAGSEKQVPNYLKPTVSSRSDHGTSNTTATATAIKTVRRNSGPDQDNSQKQKDIILRRRSFDRPPSAARVQKALISPARDKPMATRSSSFSSKSSTLSTSKPSFQRVAKKAVGAKSQSTLSSSRSIKKTSSPSPTTTTKKGIAPSSSSHSEKAQSNNHQDKKEARSQEIIKEECEESLNHHQVEEEVVKDEQVEEERYQTPRAVIEESDDLHPDSTVDATEVLIEEAKDKLDSPRSGVLSPVSEEGNVLDQAEEIEEKFDEEKSDHHQTQHDEDHHEEKEEPDIVNGHHDHQQEMVSNKEEAEAGTDQEKVEEINYNETDQELGAAKEVGEEKQVESCREEINNEDERQREVESSKEDQVVEQGEAEESKKAEAAPAAHVVVKGQVQGGAPYNNVIEETASKLLEERRNKVRALVGAFETVIDKETSNAK